MLKTIKKVIIASVFFFQPSTYSLPPTVAHAYISFERTYDWLNDGIGDDQAFSVHQTVPDGGYILAGWSTVSLSNTDVYIVKTDSLGDTLWTRTYSCPSGLSDEGGFSLQQTSDEGYIIVGASNGFGIGDDDVYLIKLNSQGDTLWTKVYGDTADDFGYSVQQTSDGGYIIAGSTWPFGSPWADVYLIKTDSLGETLWTKTFGGAYADQSYSVQQISDGGYILTGYTDSFGAGLSDVYLIKADSLGNTLWTKTYGASGRDEGHSVQQTSDGGYIIAGSTCPFGSPWADVYLIKTDSLGETLWTKTFGGAYDDQSYSVQQTQDGGFITAGWKSFSDFANYIDLYLLKIDSLGDTLWTRNYDYEGTNFYEDKGFCVQVTSDGGYIIAGETAGKEAPNWIWDFYLVKPDIWGPEILSACASDGVIPAPGIDADDYVLLTFDDPTNKPVIPPMFGIIDSVLALSGGHRWRDGAGMIESAVWDSSGTRLQINLSTNGGLPTVSVGDTITPDGVTITDLDRWANPCVSPVVITCSFDPVGISENPSDLPSTTALYPAIPNPSHRTAMIRFELAHSGKVSLKIYDLTGRLVKTLVEEEKDPGVYEIPITSNQLPASGIYFYRLQISQTPFDKGGKGDFVTTKKLILLK